MEKEKIKKEQMYKRKAIPKKLRFEVLKRDKFKCVYCGATAPDVVLWIDHMHPVSKGGENDILNLVTSCMPCNLGKSNIELKDNVLLDKQRNQLEELQERREQLEMMIQWQQGLKGVKDTLVNELKESWESMAPGYLISETGMKSIRKWNREFEYQEVLEAMQIAADQYLEFNGDKVNRHSWSIAYGKIGGILRTRKASLEKPYLQDLFYIRGILKNRIRGSFDIAGAMVLLEEGYEKGVTIDQMKRLAVTCYYDDDFIDGMEELMGAVG